MKKYFWISIGIVSASLGIFLLTTGLISSHGVKKLTRMSEKRMLAAASHCTQYIDTYIAADTMTVLFHEDVNTWLEQFSMSTGFDLIAIVDSFGFILWSSSDIYYQGDNISTSLIDTSLFHSVTAGQRYAFTPSVKIDDVLFKSLYYSFVLGGEQLVVVIDEDQDYFAEAAGFHTMVFVIFIILFAISALLLIILFIIDRKARRAYELAAQNERLAFLGRTSAELAHELKNPLGIMKASVDVLRMEFDPQKKEKNFNFLSEEIMRLSRMINTILNFSKGKSLSKEIFTPFSVLQDVYMTFVQVFPKVSVAVNVSETVKFVGDSQAFMQIANNIMRNAAAAMKEQGMITVAGVQKGKQYILSFHDTGPGIQSDIAQKIFEPFVTGSKTGTGLGLAIVKSLCEGMGWSIALLSREAGATCFAIILKESLWEK